jgi:hypothetical protein
MRTKEQLERQLEILTLSQASDPVTEGRKAYLEEVIRKQGKES